MHVICTTALEPSPIPGIEHATLAGHDDGLAQLSIWRQSIAPGCATPPHRHDCEEVVIAESGQGELHIDGAVHRFGPDCTLIIPRNVPHQIISTGDVPLRILAAFAATPIQAFFPDGEPIALPWRS